MKYNGRRLINPSGGRCFSCNLNSTCRASKRRTKTAICWESFASRDIRARALSFSISATTHFVRCKFLCVLGPPSRHLSDAAGLSVRSFHSYSSWFSLSHLFVSVSTTIFIRLSRSSSPLPFAVFLAASSFPICRADTRTVPFPLLRWLLCAFLSGPRPCVSACFPRPLVFLLSRSIGPRHFVPCTLG